MNMQRYGSSEKPARRQSGYAYELEIYGVVHVPELVKVVEAYLQRHHIMKLVISFFCHVFC